MCLRYILKSVQRLLLLLHRENEKEKKKKKRREIKSNLKNRKEGTKKKKRFHQMHHGDRVEGKQNSFNGGNTIYCNDNIYFMFIFMVFYAACFRVNSFKRQTDMYEI